MKSPCHRNACTRPFCRVTAFTASTRHAATTADAAPHLRQAEFVPDMRRVPNPRVVVTRELPDAAMDRMEQLFATPSNRGDVALTRDQLAAAMADCDVLVPPVTAQIDAGLLAGAGARL